MKNLFSNQNFWVAILTLFVLIMGTVIPGYSLDVPHAAGLAVVAGAYMVAIVIAPAAFSWGSRKFWLVILSFIGLFLDSFHVFPGTLDVANLAAAVAAVAIYILALAKDPGNGWVGLIVSRKFWGFVASIVMIMLRAYNMSLPVDITVEQMVTILAGFFTLILTAAFGKPPEPMPDPEIIDDTGVQSGAG